MALLATRSQVCDDVAAASALADVVGDATAAAASGVGLVASAVLARRCRACGAEGGRSHGGEEGVGDDGEGGDLGFPGRGVAVQVVEDGLGECFGFVHGLHSEMTSGLTRKSSI